MDEKKMTEVMNVVVESFISVVNEYGLSPQEAITLFTAGTTAFVIDASKKFFSNSGKAILGSCTEMCSAFMDAIQKIEDEEGGRVC